MSSPTSPSSSTSDAPPSGGSRIAGLIRLVHPFPSLLDGAVSTSFALVAGGSVERAAGLGLAMALLQFGIGAANDVVDAPRDAGHKPGKPIPAGLVSVGQAKLVAVGGFAGGAVLSAVAGGLPALALAVLVMAIGLAYDLVLKGTAWSWLPFAIGIPILPVFGWLGASGRLPTFFLVLLPVAVLGGAALAIANTLVDVERDRAAGVDSIALALGPSRAWLVQAGLLVAIGLAAVVSVVPLGGSSVGAAIVGALATAPVAAALVGRGGGAAARERAWEAAAAGLAVLAVSWLLAVRGG